MSNFKITKALPALTAAIMLSGMAACSDDDIIAPEQPTENSIPGQDVGIRNLKVSLPRLSRFDKVVNHVSCRIHLKGKKDRVTFPVNTFLSADKDSIYIEADDPILAELPHQMYHLNYVTFPDRSMTRSEDKEVSEDTIFVGARLSIENPDDIKFRSSFNVGANSIGSGTEEDPWIIASGDDFMVRISDPMTRGETHDGEFFEITRNLNLNTVAVAYGKGWEPAGHNNINGGSTDFNGTIDGCDNYIENLYCYTDAGCGGLFYSLGEKAYIHNLEMRRVMLIGNSDLGAFACTSKKGCRLDSIEVNGTIEGKVNVGGLIGSGYARVKKCISSVDITVPDEAGVSAIGGMIGNGSDIDFYDCIRTGRIDAPTADYVGGYVGKGVLKEFSNDDVEFTRCYVSGSIIGKNYVGGFVGNSDCEFTECHAAATLPQDSYAYSTKWDIFNLNNRMTPLPLEIKANEKYAGGFAGSSERMNLNGENSFAYSSPAKPSISASSYAGALGGNCHVSGSGAKFTSYAYVEAPEGYAGGILGKADLTYSPSFVNYGNVMGGGSYTGGVIGCTDGGIDITFTNSGNVRGKDYVGGIAGYCSEYVKNALLQNDGNVEATGDYAGGLFGSIKEAMELRDGSHVSSENGSLKITGRSYVGGICGFLQYIAHISPKVKYCPVYANIISTGGNAGGIIGNMEIWDDGIYEKVFETHYPVRVSITVDGGDNAGGAIGYLTYKSSKKVPVISGFNDNLQASITTKGNIAGGIIGRVKNETSADAYIRDCHGFTTITSTATGEVSGFGGVIGWTENSNGDIYENEINIEKCSFHGSLSGPNMTAAGGILGYTATCRVTSCYNAGRVDAVMSVGGIVGRLDGYGYIANCFNMGEVPSVSGRKWLAGILGQKEDHNSEKVTISACYNVGQTGWGIVGGEDKAKINCQNCLYLDTASDGDMKGSGSHDVTADELRNNQYYGFNYLSVWDFYYGEAAPTLKGVPMFNEKLPLQIEK